MRKFFHWLGCFIFFSGCLWSQENKKIVAYRLESVDKIKLDGRLDEGFWAQIEPAHNFRQQEPTPGDPASEKTEVRIAYDEQYLYIGAKFFDSEPSQIKAFQKRRDAVIDTDDRFVFILDTYNDQRSAFYFEINPFGLMGDGILKVGQGTTVNRSWNGIWRAWVSRDEGGWYAEIRIPFMTLNFDPKIKTWGINFLRTIRRKNEETLWSGFERNQGILRPQNAGKLLGLENINQGIGVEAIPYALATQTLQRKDSQNAKMGDISFNVGGEINYNITPNLKAGITVNTDFAETEVDDRQINLTRFPLFFPERRAFFLEGSNIFLFAPSSSPNPYFSRRIGLQDGKPIPISHGARLIGRIKNTDIGILQVRTRETDRNKAEHFTAGRIIQNIFKESSFGVLYTRRGTDGDSLPVRQTIGADVSLNTSRFLGNKNLQFEAFFIGITETFFGDSSSLSDRSARGGRINFPNQPWDAHVSYREFGVNYDPAVGFAPRVGFRRLQPSISYAPLIEKSKWIRELSWQYFFEYLMGMDWKPATVNHRFRLLGIRFESGDRFEFEVNHNYELLDFDFDILRDNRFVVPIGEYYNVGYAGRFQTAGFRRIAGTLSYGKHGFWTGTQANVNAGVTVRPFPGLNLTTSWIHSRVKLQDGNFDTHLFRLISGYDISPWISVNFNVQYDNVTKFLGSNSRFTWVISPGNTVFIVYNNNWQQFADRLLSMESRTNVKFAYTFRF